MKKCLGFAAGILILGLGLSSAAFARPPRVVVGFGPYWGPYWGGYYDPYWGYAPPPNTGDLDIDTPKYMHKDAVYIDGGYAGEAKRLKDVPLSPGTHEVELRAANGQTVYQREVNIELGHKTTINPVS